MDPGKPKPVAGVALHVHERAFETGAPRKFGFAPTHRIGTAEWEGQRPDFPAKRLPELRAALGDFLKRQVLWQLRQHRMGKSVCSDGHSCICQLAKFSHIQHKKPAPLGFVLSIFGLPAMRYAKLGSHFLKALGPRSRVERREFSDEFLPE